MLDAAALAPTGARAHAIWRSASRVWLLERTSSPSSMLTGGADVPPLDRLEIDLISANAFDASTPISTVSFESCVARRPKPTNGGSLEVLLELLGAVRLLSLQVPVSSCGIRRPGCPDL